MKVVHLILKYVYYDMIDKGKKTVEYRDLTDYWYNRIFTNKPNTVVFHKGYSKTTMSFRIAKITANIQTMQLEIKLGERVTWTKN